MTGGDPSSSVEVLAARIRLRSRTHRILEVLRLRPCFPAPLRMTKKNGRRLRYGPCATCVVKSAFLRTFLFLPLPRPPGQALLVKMPCRPQLPEQAITRAEEIRQEEENAQH